MEKEAELVDKGSSHSHLDEKVDMLPEIDVFGADMQAVPEDLVEAAEYARTMTPEAIEETIYRIVDEHDDDPNFPPAVLAAARRYLHDPELKKNPVEYQHVYDELKVEAALIIINSPYAEVRAVVDNHDDPSISAHTFRTWVIGTIFVGAGGFINQFFSIRYRFLYPFTRKANHIRANDRNPRIAVYANVAQVLAFPCAKLMELLPTKKFTTFGWTWSLNSGPFNPKEHMLITIMANVGFAAPYTANVSLIDWQIYFSDAYPPLYHRSSGSSTFLSILINPGLLVSDTKMIALNRAFHAEKKTEANGWKLSRMRWFLYCFCAMFVYFWFPNFIFQALSYFNWMTWIAPENIHLAAITGSISGLGFNPIPTFDWNQFSFQLDPLIYPFFSTFNTFLGAMIAFPIIVALWYTNTWYTGHLPINSNHVFDNAGSFYNVTNAVGDNTLFDQTAFQNYSPAYLSAGNIVIYGFFCNHAFLYHRREIGHGFKSMFSRKKTAEMHTDIHVRLMMAYKEVPEWQYLAILLISIGIGAAGVGAYPTETSPAVVLYGVFLAVIFVVPIGIILSITNVQITLNVIAELFGGIWFPGNAVAMNYFKAYGYVTTAHTLNFAQDLKLAHYMHIPPVQTFWAQIYATIVSSFICTGILTFQMTKIADVCTPHQRDHFTCPDVSTFFTASVLWGTLGPKRMFGAGGMYNGLLYCFLAGALVPIPVYMLRKRFKTLEYFHLPVFLTGGLIWAPYNMFNLWPAVPVAYVFNVIIKKKYLAWWSKYNYITSTAFSSSIAICAVVIFFAVQWPGVTIDWIGNNRPFLGCDAEGCPRLPIPDQGWFGPGVGEFH
ncbi:OPT-domain-containing protein [Mycena rebaudengoi]|nr:OPT-domain-containing protein [Mycena rebaudengoi]